MAKLQVHVQITVVSQMNLQIVTTVCLYTQHYAKSAYIIIWEMKIYDIMCSGNRTTGNANRL